MINSNQDYCLTLGLSSDIYELGQKQKIETILMVLVSLEIFLVIVMFSIKKTIIDRVESLNRQVDQITMSKETQDRVGVEGTDEIGQLSNGINAMLTEIESMHMEVKKHAATDEMTGVFNRRAGYNALSMILDKVEKT